MLLPKLFIGNIAIFFASTFKHPEPSWCERLARTHYLIYINFQNGMVIITIISCTTKFPIYWVGHKA
jgi:hypothetical protein